MSEVVGPFDQTPDWGALESTSLKNAAQYTANKYQGPLLQNQVTAGNLENQRASDTLPYAGPQAAATLSQTQLGNQKNQLLMPYVVPEAQAGINQKNAQTNYLGTEASVNNAKIPGLQWASAHPETQLPGMAGILGLYKDARDSGDTDLANRINGYMASKAQPDSRSLDPVTKLRNGAVSIIQNENPGISASEAQTRQLAYENGPDQNGNYTTSDGRTIPAPSSAVQNQVSAIIKGSAGVSKLKQQAAALNAEKALQLITPYAQGASQYSGAFGHAKLVKDGLLTSTMGQTIPEYQAYQKFSRMAPEAAVQMITASDARGTNPMIQSYKNLMNPVTWQNDPVNSFNNFQDLLRIYRASVGTTAGMNPAEIKNALKQQTNKSEPSQENSPSESLPQSNTSSSTQKSKKGTEVYVIRDSSGNRVRVNGKAIGGSDEQTKAFLKDHPGFSREKLNG